MVTGRDRGPYKDVSAGVPDLRNNDHRTIRSSCLAIDASRPVQHVDLGRPRGRQSQHRNTE